MMTLRTRGDGHYVLVAGWPASGKTSVATALAIELGLARLSKDDVKEALMTALGRPATVEASQQLGRAAVLAVLRIAAACPGLVLDSTFLPYALPAVRALPGPLVEVRCLVDRDLARSRHLARARSRDAGHLDDQRSEQELWGTPSVSLGLAPAIQLDTSGAVDIPALAEQVRVAAVAG